MKKNCKTDATKYRAEVAVTHLTATSEVNIL